MDRAPLDVLTYVLTFLFQAPTQNEGEAWLNWLDVASFAEVSTVPTIKLLQGVPGATNAQQIRYLWSCHQFEKYAKMQLVDHSEVDLISKGKVRQVFRMSDSFLAKLGWQRFGRNTVISVTECVAAALAYYDGDAGALQRRVCVLTERANKRSANKDARREKNKSEVKEFILSQCAEHSADPSQTCANIMLLCGWHLLRADSARFYPGVIGTKMLRDYIFTVTASGLTALMTKLDWMRVPVQTYRHPVVDAVHVMRMYPGAGYVPEWLRERQEFEQMPEINEAMELLRRVLDTAEQNAAKRMRL